MDYDIKKLKELDLVLPENNEIFTVAVKSYIQMEDMLECRRFNNFFNAYFQANQDFEKKHPEEFKEYQLLQRECRWVALPIISDDQAVGCYNRFIDIAWAIPSKYDLINPSLPPYTAQDLYLTKKLEQHLDGMLLYLDRDKFKNKIQNALRTSEEQITNYSIVEEQKKYKPTLSHWLDIYFSEVGTGEVNKLRVAEFYAKNKHFQKLTPDEQAKLKIIFKIYEMMKLSSFTLEGNESEIPYSDERGIGLLAHGKITRYDNDERKEWRKFLNKNKDTLLKAGIINEDYFKEPEKETKNINITNKMDLLNSYKDTNEPKGVKHDDFSESDSREVEAHKKIIMRKPQNKTDQAEIIATLKENLNLTFADVDIERRFDNIIFSYLKGLRDRMELREILSHPLELGGMGYKINLADQITEIIKDVQVGSLSINAPEKKAEKAKITLPSYSVAQGLIKKTQEKAAKMPKKRPTIPPAPIVISEKTPVPKKEYGMVIPQVKRLNPSKSIVQDIKTPPKEIKLVGPLEELSLVDLNKFRRLGDTPVEAAEKVKAKIDLLEEQSLTEKAKGIVAFKNSPLNRVYLQIGNKSIEEGRSVAEVISEFEKLGQPMLSKEEFDVMADLNKKLRF